MRDIKKLFAMAFMFYGMIVGLIIVIHLPVRESAMDIQRLLDIPENRQLLSRHKLSMIELVQVIKAKQRLQKIMHKDVLTTGDSLEIIAIDKQLNQLLHD